LSLGLWQKARVFDPKKYFHYVGGLQGAHLGRLWPYLQILALAEVIITNNKHPSLFGKSVSNKENKFYNMNTSTTKDVVPSKPVQIVLHWF
jgi:hypothetical protein